jgi:hypothetical protein
LPLTLRSSDVYLCRCAPPTVYLCSDPTTFASAVAPLRRVPQRRFDDVCLCHCAPRTCTFVPIRRRFSSAAAPLRRVPLCRSDDVCLCCCAPPLRSSDVNLCADPTTFAAAAALSDVYLCAAPTTFFLRRCAPSKCTSVSIRRRLPLRVRSGCSPRTCNYVPIRRRLPLPLRSSNVYICADPTTFSSAAALIRRAPLCRTDDVCLCRCAPPTCTSVPIRRRLPLPLRSSDVYLCAIRRSFLRRCAPSTCTSRRRLPLQLRSFDVYLCADPKTCASACQSHIRRRGSARALPWV